MSGFLLTPRRQLMCACVYRTDIQKSSKWQHEEVRIYESKVSWSRECSPCSFEEDEGISLYEDRL